MAALLLDDPQPYEHQSVLLTEVLSIFRDCRSGTIVDATVGAGGHCEGLLIDNPRLKIIGCDRDENALDAAGRRLAPFGDRVALVKAEFRQLRQQLRELGLEQVSGLLADLGVSSLQLDHAERGMSFRSEGPIDMRMDQDGGETAAQLIARLRQNELADLIYEFGEERASRRIARCIKQAQTRGHLRTTLDLRRAVIAAVGPRRVAGLDPATRTFQALRIAVNSELDQLDTLLELASELVAPGGTVAIISFHSLEDRRVKRALANRNRWQPLTKKPLTASSEEYTHNPRSRSAKLRAARRLQSPSPSELSTDQTGPIISKGIEGR